LRADLGHQKAEGTVDHLERGLGIELHNAYLPVVLCSSVGFGILCGGITYLEESLRNSFILVGLKGLEQSWNKGRSHHFILDCLWVGQSDGFVKIRFGA